MHANVNRDEILQAIRSEMVDWRVWAGRILVMAFAALAGLTVVAFTWMTELAFGAFEQVQHRYTWWSLLWTPLCTAAIVWVTRRYVIGTVGSVFRTSWRRWTAAWHPRSVACMCR